MGRPRTWTDEQLREAVAASTSYKQVKERLGLSITGENHYDLKARVHALGLDTSHFAQKGASTRMWTEEELRLAVAGAGTRVEVLERLRAPVQSKYFKRLDRDLQKLELVSQLTGRTRGRRRRWTDEQLRVAVAGARGVSGAIRALGLIPAGGNYDQIQRRIRELALDTTHFQGSGWSRGQKLDFKPKLPLTLMLVANRWTNSQKLKERLIREGLKKPACEICGWAQRSPDGRLPIELDHINGDKNDNRLENLRILCPNCHSLQPTHRGSNQRRRNR